jgi:hypothetical protein
VCRLPRTDCRFSTVEPHGTERACPPSVVFHRFFKLIALR